MLLEVGRVDKPHGLQGEVVVSLTTTEHDRVAPNSVLFAGDRRLLVLRSSPHHHRFIVQFEGVASREDAEALQGLVLSGDAADEPAAGDDEFWAHDVIGSEVVGVDGTAYGRVEALQVNPASDLLLLESGALVPLTFVVRWLERGKRLEIDPPAGLFDLDA